MAYANGYDYRRSITIDSSEVSGTSHTDFPVLINVVLDSSHVTSSSGYDVVITDATDTALAFDLESYDNGTGRWIGWVKVPSLSGSADIDLYIYYGNSSVTTNQSSTSTWSALAGVWFLNEASGGAAAMKDRTATANHMSTNGSQLTFGVTGKITTALSRNGSTAEVSRATTDSNMNNPSGDLIVMAWVKSQSNSQNGNGQAIWENAAGRFRLYTTGGANWTWRTYETSGTISTIGSQAMALNTWQHMAVRISSAAGASITYIDGSQSGTSATVDSYIGTNNTVSVLQSTSTSQGMNAAISHLMIINADKGADWITTAYTNQNDPASFYTVGSEETSTPSSGAVAFLQGAEDTSDQTTYTFSSQNLGTAADDRHIIVGILSRKAGATTTISSVTVGGVSATIVEQVTNTGTNSDVAGIAIAAVPTGTTGDVVVTFGAGMVRAAISLYRATGLDSATASQSLNSTASAPAVNLDIPVNGFAIGAGITAASSTATWSGLTEDYDTTLESFVTVTSAHDVFTDGATDEAISITFGSSNEPAGVFAAWGFAAESVDIEVADTLTSLTVDTTTITQNHIIVPQDILISLSADNTTVINESISVDTYYFDAHDGISDPDGAWTNDANAFIDDTSSASTSASGSTSSNFLRGNGTSSPTFGGAISQVRVRVHGVTGLGGSAAIYTEGLGELLLTHALPFNLSPTTTSYEIVPSPSGGWTWGKVSELEAKIYATDGVQALYYIEIEVTSEEITVVDIHPNDELVSLSVDSTTITQNHLVTAQDQQFGLSVDSTSLSQNHVLQAADIAIVPALDNSTITQNHTVATQGVGLTTAEDGTTITETNFIITAADVILNLAVADPALTQNHVVAPQDIALAASVATTTINQNHIITAQDTASSLTEDSTTIELEVVENHDIETQDVVLSLSAAATTISQNHVMVSNDTTLSLAMDNTTVVETNFLLIIQDAGLGLTAETTAIAQNHILASQSAALSQAIGGTTITQDHVLAAAALTLASLLDASSLEQTHVLNLQNIALALRIDSAGLEGGEVIIKYYLDFDGNIFWILGDYFIDLEGVLYRATNLEMRMFEPM